MGPSQKGILHYGQFGTSFLHNFMRLEFENHILKTAFFAFSVIHSLASVKTNDNFKLRKAVIFP